MLQLRVDNGSAIWGRAWELRTATSLARLWAAQGRRVESKALLAPVYGAFDEGLGTPDLEEARTVLAALP